MAKEPCDLAAVVEKVQPALFEWSVRPHVGVPVPRTMPGEALLARLKENA